MTIHANDGQFRPILGLDRSVADAVQIYCEQTFPINGRRKSVANHFDISMDEARTLLEARPSRGLLDRVFKRGGWALILPVMGAVVGQTADAFLINEKKRLADERRSFEEAEARLDDMASTVRAVVPLHLGTADRKAG